MEYRRLGRTGLQVSLLGVGGGYLMLNEHQIGTQIYQRAVDLGLNYFDGRYGQSSTMQRPVLGRHRERCIVATKTADSTKEGALRRIDEDLEELGTDYLDIFYLRTYTREMLDAHMAPGGSIEGMLEARDQGKIRAIGLSNHSDPAVSVAGIETGLFDVVLFPLNIVRREALDGLIPAAQKHDVGLAVMKPLSVGKIPAETALRWLVNQPIHTIVAGMSSMEHLEMDVAAVERCPLALSPEEEAEIERCRQELDRETCRICKGICNEVCEIEIPISSMIHHDVLHEHYRNLGLEAFLEFPLTPWAKKAVGKHFARRLSLLQSCTRCGLCEETCPHHLPIMDMLEDMLEGHQSLIQAVEEREWVTRYADSESPYWSQKKKR